MPDPTTKVIKPTAVMAGKFLYGLLFLVVIPLGEWYWSLSLDKQLALTGIHHTIAGSIFMLSGLLLMVWAMHALKKFGKGLPMNAYPPALLVKQGPYRWVRHPIYWGYGLLITGVALYTGSGAALRIVVPISILAMVALVLGYEGIYLREKFKGEDRSVLLDLPASNDQVPSFQQRLIVLLWTSSLFIASQISLHYFGYRITTPSYSAEILVILISALFQLIALVYSFLPVFFLLHNHRLRQWMRSMIIGLSIVDFFMWFWPNAGTAAAGNPALAGFNLPQFPWLTTPWILILISGSYWITRFPGRKVLSMFIGVALIAFSQIINKQPAEAILVNMLIFLIARYHEVIWRKIRQLAEQLANSWKEWTIGPVRIFSHSIYVGLGSFSGIFACGMLVGKQYSWALLIFAIIVIIAAAVWAQLIEGSDQLKRPFGYYGAVAGILIAGTLLWLMGYEIWPLIGALSVLMPWIQAAGRLRCLVNGCCHGSVTENEELGIRYFHPRSRVCTISGLKGKLLHPTPVYSLLWLFVTGLLLLRLWQLDFGYTFLFGLYLILTSLGRFAEEAYRGEVQTPVWNKLRLYQWVAIVVMTIGIGFTILPLPHKNLPPNFGWEIVAAAAIGGLFTFFSMGVDFPNSNARFSRLV